MLSRRLLRIKAVQSLYAALERGENGGKVSPAVNEFSKSADSCYQLYLVFLDLLVKIREYAEERVEIGKAKFHPTEAELHPNMRFIENPVLEKVSEAMDCCEEELPIDWSQQREIVAELYGEMVSSDYYSFYMGLAECNFSRHKKVLQDFLVNTLADNVNVMNLVEEKSIYWTDDIEYAASFIYESIERLKKNDTFVILEKYDDSEVADFGKELVRNGLLEYEENLKLIVGNSKNWDPERISVMDKVILLTAIAEIKNFPSIPVKVSIDEYLEISKYYSTEDSSVFINGILDKVVRDLDSAGLIRKEGRGLLQQ